MEKIKRLLYMIQTIIPRILQLFLNICLIILALFLVFLMFQEMIVFSNILFSLKEEKFIQDEMIQYGYI